MISNNMQEFLEECVGTSTRRAILYQVSSHRYYYLHAFFSSKFIQLNFIIMDSK